MNDDFTFEMKVQPGQRLIRVSPQFPGATLKAVRLNGADVTDSGIDVRPERRHQRRGDRAHDPGERAVGHGRRRARPGGEGLLRRRVREGSARWTTGSRYFGGGRPDQDGRFKVRNLPPGDYYAIALDYVEPGAGTDPEFLERIRDRATPFSMTEGAVKTLDLKLAIAP